jgi:hypothetical protein
MIKNKFVKIAVYSILLVSTALLIWNISLLNFENLKSNQYASIISNICTITAMILVLFGLRKNVK